MKRSFLLLITSFFSLTSAHAVMSMPFGSSTLRVTPIVGLERVVKVSPVQKTKTRTIFGVNVMYGSSFLSAEAEVTKSDDSETLYDQDITEKEESYAAK